MSLDARPARKVRLLPHVPRAKDSSCNLRAIHILHNAACKTFSLHIVSNTLLFKLFRASIVLRTERGQRPLCIRTPSGLAFKSPQTWLFLCETAISPNRSPGHSRYSTGLAAAQPVFFARQ